MTLDMFGWFFLTPLAILGALLVANKKREGFVVWIISDCGWLLVDLVVGLYSQAALFLVYLCISVAGFHAWRLDE